MGIVGASGIMPADESAPGTDFDASSIDFVEGKPAGNPGTAGNVGPKLDSESWKSKFDEIKFKPEM